MKKRILISLLLFAFLPLGAGAQQAFEGELVYKASSFGIKSSYTEWHKRGNVAAQRPMSSEVVVFRADEGRLYSLKDGKATPKEESVQHVVVGTGRETVGGRRCVKVTYELHTTKSVIYREEWVDPSVDIPYHYGRVSVLPRGLVVRQVQKITGKGHPAIKTTSNLESIRHTTVPDSRFAVK